MFGKIWLKYNIHQLRSLLQVDEIREKLNISLFYQITFLRVVDWS